MKILGLIAGTLAAITFSLEASASALEGLSVFKAGTKLVAAAKTVGLTEALEKSDNLIILLPSEKALDGLAGLPASKVKDVLLSHIFLNNQPGHYVGTYQSLNGVMQISVNGMGAFLFRTDGRDADVTGTCGSIGSIDYASDRPAFYNYSATGTIYLIGDTVLTVNKCRAN